MPASRKTLPAFLAATLALALAATLAPAPVRACGPDFPNAYLADGSVSLLNAPEGYFAAEIAKLAPAPDKTTASADSAAESLIAAANAAKRKNELTETGILRLELAKRGLAPARIDALAAELETARASIFAKAWDKTPNFSDDMPAEFVLYLNGAFVYWKGDSAAARANWTKLLALPENERRHYTVNATYMLGRMYFSGDIPGDTDTSNRAPAPGAISLEPDAAAATRESARWLSKTRDAIAAGFENPDELAAASLGWEARAWLHTGDYAKAIHLYTRQYATGNHDEKNSALQSLRITAAAALERAGMDGQTATEKNLRALAQDELSRRVVTIYLLSRIGLNYYEDAAEQHLERRSRAWAAILQKTGLHDVPDADRIAWIAYQAGNFDMARQWVDIAPQDSVPANWIRAKLALRDGNLADGETLLEKVTASSDLPGAARPIAWSELGRVRMSRGEYTAALDAFLRGSHWEDSAYIAERVLTLDELQSYVDQRCPEYTRPAEDPHDYHWRSSEPAARNTLRHLLARRLARANQSDAAGKYFPDELREIYSDYITEVRQGFDAALPAEKRARAFWRAALAIHEKGMELLGTELAPDYFIWDGSFDANRIAPARQGPLRHDPGPATPTADELKRLKENVVPEKRYHYRYRAAELGLWAASLMPNDNDETAAMLNTAGNWLKARDPKAANTFYHALVIRCPNTALGKAAAKKGWLVDATEK